MKILFSDINSAIKIVAPYIILYIEFDVSEPHIRTAQASFHRFAFVTFAVTFPRPVHTHDRIYDEVQVCCNCNSLRCR